MESANLGDASARIVKPLKGFTSEDGEVAAAVPGRNLYRWVAVSFCLLCILQAVLNISLHLTQFAVVSDSAVKDDKVSTDASCKNQTAERDEQERINLVLQQKSLTRERDELRRKLNDFVHYSQQGWVYFNNSFYYVSSTTKTWQDSRNDCLQKTADLMVVNSYEEQKFTKQFQKITWIGLSDSETEGVWKWVDSTPLAESFWRSGEPNNYNGRNEDCVEIRNYNDDNSWNDVLCESKNFWICEKKMTS